MSSRWRQPRTVPRPVPGEPPRELSPRLYGLVQRFCPSNIVLRRVHTRTGIKWGPLVGLDGIVVYGLVMVATGTIVRDGGPGWVNLFFIIGFWNTCRYTILIPPRWSGCCGSAIRGLIAERPARRRVAPSITDEAERQVEHQRAQIALAAQRLGLRMADEFVDVGYSGMSMDRPELRRLLDHVAAHRVGFCVLATSDRLSEDPEHMADIDEALDDALVAIVIATDHIDPTAS